MSNATKGDVLIEEAIAESMDIFDSRSRPAHNVRVLVQQDKDLAADVDNVRLQTARQLYERLMEIEPCRFPEISDAKLLTIAEAFKAALIALERGSEDKKVDIKKRTALGIALISST